MRQSGPVGGDRRCSVSEDAGCPPAGRFAGPTMPQFPQRLESRILLESLDLKTFLTNAKSLSHRAN